MGTTQRVRYVDGGFLSLGGEFQRALNGLKNTGGNGEDKLHETE